MRKRGLQWLLILACIWLAPNSTRAQVLAFPEAEGFGRFATGARTNLASATVYHVTNLNDSGPGSFRDAVSQSNRFVVFDVGGILKPTSPLTFASNLTIAGQTAPGGFAVYGNRAAFHGANNLISRHWAVRLGTSQGRADAASIVRGTNMMFDHMSITWGVDGTFDINPDPGQIIDNLTIQNSIIGQGLDVVGHSTGGLIQPGSGRKTSILKSLFIDNVTRNPKVRDENEFINNVVYGWESAGYIMGDTSGTSNANVEGNYFIEGPVDGSAPFNSGTPSFHIYPNDNWVDANRNGLLDGTLITSYPGADVVATRHPFPTTTSMSAQQAVEHVMKHAGNSIIRDAVDTRLMQEVASYGTLGGVIIRESDLFPGYGTNPSYLNPRARLTDADNDGIADNWESAHGLNPANGTDWKGLNANGYTRLEEYLNELGGYGNTVTSAGGEWTSAASWSGTVPNLADDALATGNLSMASGHAFARRLSITGSLSVTGGTVDIFDTANLGGSLNISGGVVTAGRTLVATPGRTEVIFVQSGATLQSATVASAGGSATLILNGGTFRSTGAPDIQVATIIGTAGGTIDTAGNSGQVSGPIFGSGSLIKKGAGSLTLSAVNSLSGPLHVQGGTVKLGPTASISAVPSIELDAVTMLDATAVPGGMVLGNAQVISGMGTINGNLTAASGSIVRPYGEVTGSVHTIGIQAEDLNLTSDWAIFDNAVHGTGNGGSYNGNGLFGGGIVLVNNQSLSAPVASGLISATVNIPQAGPWYLFARTAEPSLSVIPGDPATATGGNNSLWVSGNATTLQATTSNFEEVQTPDNAPDAAKWVKLSPTLPALNGVWGALNPGIDYNLSAGLKTFTIGGREVGTVLDGFVLTTSNLDTFQLDAALNGSSGFLLGNTLTVNGNYSQSSGATMAIEIGSEDSYNKLTVNGTATLGGMLDVALVDGFQPRAGDVFEILSASNGFTGTFNGGISWPALDGALQWDISYETATKRVLLEVSTPLSADFDGDGDVDESDLLQWQASYNVDNLADANGDGKSDGRDFLLWQRQFTGDLTSALSVSSQVPEPSTAVMLLAAVASGILLQRESRKPRPTWSVVSSQ